jgi:hypothetical protein
VFTRVLNVITFGIPILFKKQEVHEYKIDHYTTYQFEPSPEYVNAAMKDSQLESSIRKRKDMYMIVGLQVAKSAIVYHALDNTKNGGVEGGAPIAATGIEIDAHVDVTKKSQMSDKVHIEKPFVFAYRIRACIHKNGAYRLRSGPKVPAHGAPRLYDTDDRASIQMTSFVDDPQFKLSRIDGNEDMIAGQYHVSESMNDGNPTERMIVLQESRPKWLYYAPAIGILVYAWLIHSLFGKVT